MSLFRGLPILGRARRLPLTVVICSVLVWTLTACHGRGYVDAGKGKASSGVTSNLVDRRERAASPNEVVGIGTVAGSKTVLVKSLIDGQIVRIDFHEGQEVHSGDVLAVLDDRALVASLDLAKANFEKDKAGYDSAKLTLDRDVLLEKENIIPKQSLDAQRATTDQLAAQLAADQALIDSAKVQLSYSRITAPISGRVGLLGVDLGNTIHAYDANGLVTITQLQPIAVVFTLPPKWLPFLARIHDPSKVVVRIYSEDDKHVLGVGHLLTSDTSIDPTTGTSRFKALAENENRTLWPNEFVHVHVLLPSSPSTQGGVKGKE